MGDKVQHNQSFQNQNVGVSSWPQQWQNLQNSFMQQRAFGYWPQWGAPYSLNMAHGNGVLPHPSMSYPNFQNFQYPTQMNLNAPNTSFNPSNNLNSGNVNNLNNKSNPPLPNANSNNKLNNGEQCSKSVENPDKIPLPDGPPPPEKPFPPLPSNSNANSNVHSQMTYFNSNSQPIKFNLNQQNKSFTPFNLSNKKNKRKKNKNQSNIPFSAMFNNSTMPVNFNPPKTFPNNQIPPLPPLPPGNSNNEGMSINNASQDSTDNTESASCKDVSSIPLMQNQQPSHDDWPPSLLEYIKRCYLKCETSIDKDQVGIILKGKITSAMTSNSLFTKNWDLEPLPNLRGTKFEQPQIANVTMNLNNMNFRGRNKFNDALKNRLGRNRNYRGSKKRSMSKSSSPNRNYRSRSKSRSRSRSRSSSKSRSRSRSGSPNIRRKRKNSDSNSSNENIKHFNKSKPDKKNSKKSKKKEKRQGAFYSNIAFGETESVSTERLQQRAARFKESLDSAKPAKKPLVIASSINTIVYTEDTEGDFDYNDLHIVGTCKDLEKPFLRLTSAPDASQVRPVDVLEKSLELIKAKWIEDSDYRYTCEQLKSVRQDLTVQGIRNDFTVKVYETHARICLEKGDPEEFNQCQTQLRMLYSDLGGDNKFEFVAYRILYYIYTKNALDLTTSIGSLTAEEKEDECVDHALKVAQAWCMNNYHRFFWLYQLSPKMSSYLIDWFIERERKSALKTMIKAYRQSLPVVFVADKLGFESMEKFLEFASTFNLAYCDIERSKIDCKASMASLGNF